MTSEHLGRPMELPTATGTVWPSIAQIRTSSHVYGTGFLVTERGLLVTALHVLRNAQRDEPAEELRAGFTSANSAVARPGIVSVGLEAIAEDEAHDLAVLQLTRNVLISTPRPPSPSGNVTPCRVVTLDPIRPPDGTPVAVSGYAVGNAAVVTTMGCISTAWHRGNPVPEGASWFLIDAWVDGGSSGAPVYRIADAAVIGICKGRDLRPIYDQQGQPMAATTENGQEMMMLANSGMALVVPAEYLVALLRPRHIH